MKTTRRIFFLGSLVMSQVLVSRSFCQELDINPLLTHPWVDSVFESMSITERINQLLILGIDENKLDETDLPSTFGGFYLYQKQPEIHSALVNSIQEQTIVPSIVFSMNESGLGIPIDGIIQWNSPDELASIAEPHLFYETGKAIGKHCVAFGIHGPITPSDIQINKDAAGIDWRLSEINQGLIDQHILPYGYLKIRPFYELPTQNLSIRDLQDMIVIDPHDIPDIHAIVQEALSQGQLDLQELEAKSKKILALKLWAGLDKRIPITKDLWYKELHNRMDLLVKHELTRAALVVLINERNLIPVHHLENIKIASLTIGKENNAVFQDYLDNYTRVDHFQASYYASDMQFSDLWTKLNEYDLIIAGVYESPFLKAPLNGTESYVIFQEWLNESGKCILTYFGDPQILNGNNSILKNRTLILSRKDDNLNNSLVPQLIFGGIGADGIIPVMLGEFPEDYGIQLDHVGRFSYLNPEAAGLDGNILIKIDSIVEMAIKEKAIPGCEILVAKDSKVIFKRSYGFHTYDSLRQVTDNDLYDLASVTKVSGALPALMKLYQEGKFDLEANLGTYLKYYKRGNKKKLTFREILAHQAGLYPYIVYWQTAIKKNGKYKRKTLNTASNEDYQYEIAPGLYLHKDYKKKIYKQIRKSKLGEKKYLYSGLSFLLYPDIVEAITGEDFQDYISKNFYDPLGAYSITYNPLDKFPLDQIVPTEYDSLFRKLQIHGTVHDEAAVMLEGVSTNAGLFANANDLAKLYQMYCNYGTFGGREYLNEETVKEFTRCQFPENGNRRALGFDRPLPEPHENGNTAIATSQLSFGHTGFTGTFVWADPVYNLVYIFLSNRVYPTRKNSKLYDMNVRTNIQQVIYDAMITD